MRHELSLTFGSRDVLQRIIQENTDRHLLLLAGSATDEGLLLLDVSGTPAFSPGGSLIKYVHTKAVKVGKDSLALITLP
ncbi:hypothetical protein [Levilactobacillus brevis]|uniref:hypothetical protein n=1 Tax=Levilactobacillus brevis TaxID=1580 RepID=UPI001CDCA0F9|nr:hypothetical protein [Levilactobacillus brevis]